MESRQHQQHPRNPGKRALLFVPILLALFAGLATFALQQQHDTANGRHTPKLLNLAPADLPPAEQTGVRGNIYDRNFNELAVSYKTTAVYARPLEVDDPVAAAGKLAVILDLDGEKLAASLKSERVFVWLGREIEKAKSEKIKALDIKGIYLVDEMNRFYPHNTEAAHLLGFANREQGLDGIEFYYDSVLRGISSGREWDRMFCSDDAPGTGMDRTDLILTLDLRTQTSLERFLASLVKKTGAASGTAALISPGDGAIFAMASLPTFDPNFFWEFTEADRRNRFLVDHVVAGGLDGFLRQAATFAEVKYLAAMLDWQAKTRHPNTTYLIPEKYKKRIYDQGAVLAGETLASLLARLNSLPPAEADLAAATSGRDNEADRPEASPRGDFTPLQLLSSFCFVLNGGRPITPRLLAGAWDRRNGRELQARSPKSTEVPATPELRQAVLDVLLHLGRKGPADSLLLQALLPPEGSAPLVKTLSGSADAATEELKVNYLLLGAAPQPDPAITMLVVLEQADFSSLLPVAGDSQPVSAISSRFINNLVRWSQADRTASSPAARINDEKIKRIMLVKRKEQVETASLPMEFRKLRMPEITGRSLRQGLQALQQYNLRISIVGSGLIVAQHPRAGASFKPGDDCVLKLQTAQ